MRSRNIELDHVFICCAAGAPEASALSARGLIEGSGNSHRGQGTTCRRFFFSNAYLELLWVTNPREAQSEAVLPTQLWDRWQQRTSGACPFGLVFRPGSDPVPPAPFPAWSYRPPYLSGDRFIQVATGVALAEPLLFYLPFAKRRENPHPEPITHPAGIREIVSIRVSLPNPDSLSQAVRSVATGSLLSIGRGAEFHLDLFYAGDAATSFDLRPDLPLSFVPERRSSRKSKF